jgi:hypothetical protein
VTDPATSFDPSLRFRTRTVRGTTRYALRIIRERLGDNPVFLPIVLRATPLGTSRQLDDDTQIVIEGFPRSGNTFALHALRHAERAEGRDVAIKSHVHTPSQVKLAVRRKIPTLLVIREPVHTVASLVIAAAHVPVAHALDEYIHHHEQVLPYHDGFVVGEFTQVTKDYASVIDRVNQRFGTSFARFDQSAENVEEVFREIEAEHERVWGGTETGVPRPSTERNGEKEWLLEQIQSPTHAARLARAQALFEELAGPA